MPRVYFWLLVFVALLCDDFSTLGAQPSKVRISYSGRSNSVTPFQIAHKGFFGAARSTEGAEDSIVQFSPIEAGKGKADGDPD
jgi:hypothetical protein